MGLPVADADDVAQLVPVVVGVEAVALVGGPPEAELPLTAGKGEAAQILPQPPLAHQIDGLEVHQHADLHRRIQQVGPGLQLPAHLRALPGVPVRDVGEFRLPREGPHLAQGVQLIFLAAGMAGEAGALALGLALGEAVGALVEDALQAVRPEGLADLHALIPLPGEVIEGEHPVQQRVQLAHGLFPDLLPGQQTPDCGADGHVPLLQAVVQWVPGKGALGEDAHHRRVQPLEHQPQPPGQGRGRAVEAVAGLRVEQHAAALLVQGAAHVREQLKIRDELVGGDAADAPHEPLLAHKAVGGADDASGLGIEDAGDDLQVDKAGVIHQNQIGPLAQLLHPLGFVGEAGLLQIPGAQGPDQPAEKERRPFRLPVSGPWQSQDFLIAEALGLDLHRRGLLRFFPILQ